MFKKILKFLLFAVIIAIIFILNFFWRDANVAKYDTNNDGIEIPLFSKIELAFSHEYDGKFSLPIAPSAFIDIDNDGIDELWFGGGRSQNDKIFKYQSNKLLYISSNFNLAKELNQTSLGVATADFDNNGFQDIIVSRENGLHLYYNVGGTFTHKKINTPLDEKSIPTGITLGDIDKDGDLDIFLSAYIKKELMEGQTIFEDKNYGATSVLLLNEGNDTFKNINKFAGLDYIHNTFMGILVDMDNDTNLDLVVAHDTGEVRTYKNNGNLTFSMIKNPTTDKFAYPMGIALGDYNNDGLVDFMFSNTGSTLPRFMAKGDIKDASKFTEKWIVFKNEGNFKFSDVAKESLLADYEFSWGAVFADMNNDALQDLIVAENYIDLAPNKLFRLPGRLLLQKKDHTFFPSEKISGVQNPNFGITPLVSDLNNDGNLDLIWTNIGSKSQAFINQGNKNHFIKIHIPKNAKNMGARISVQLHSGKQLTDFLITGEGLASDQSATIHFGLGKENTIDKIEINRIDGSVESLENPSVDSTIQIK